MSDDRLLFELSDGIAILTLNRPEVMNAFEDGMREALFERLEECAENRDVRCVVITGAGRAFSAGGDIASMAKLQEENDLSVVEARMSIAGQVIQQIRRMPQPVLAAINGAAAGGGMNLALACDMRIASDRAKFGVTFLKLGIIPGDGGTWILPRIIGEARAAEVEQYPWHGRDSRQVGDHSHPLHSPSSSNKEQRKVASNKPRSQINRLGKATRPSIQT